MRTIDGHLVGVYATPTDTRVWHWSVREDDKPMCGNGVGIRARSTGAAAAYAIECHKCRSLFEGRCVMANDGWVRRDPRTGQRQKRSWVDEIFDCLTTVVALAAVGLLTLAAVVGAIVKVVAS